MGYEPPCPPSVSAAQFVRQFAECRDLARQQPVFVTSYGRITHALIAVEDLEALQSAAADRAEQAGSAAAGALLRDLGLWQDCAQIVCDAQMRIESLNARAGALCRVEEGEAVGRPFDQALPAAADTLVATLAFRTALSGEPASADIPSPFSEGAWVRIRSFVWAGRTIILIRDITVEVRSERLADGEASIVEAMALHGGVAHLRLSLRGTIEAVGDPFCALVGLPRRRLLGVQLADLVDVAGRPQMRAAIEAVLREEAGRRLAVRLIRNAGGTTDATIALVRLQGSYGVEGAVALLARTDSQD